MSPRLWLATLYGREPLFWRANSHLGSSLKTTILTSLSQESNCYLSSLSSFPTTYFTHNTHLIHLNHFNSNPLHWVAIEPCIEWTSILEKKKTPKKTECQGLISAPYSGLGSQFSLGTDVPLIVREISFSLFFQDWPNNNKTIWDTLLISFLRSQYHVNSNKG